jgi:hypothetical protein
MLEQKTITLVPGTNANLIPALLKKRASVGRGAQLVKYKRNTLAGVVDIAAANTQYTRFLPPDADKNADRVMQFIDGPINFTLSLNPQTGDVTWGDYTPGFTQITLDYTLDII